MIIQITRHYFTRDITQGILTVAKDSPQEAPSLQGGRGESLQDSPKEAPSLQGGRGESLLTLEPSLPRDFKSYIGHCVPPGDYECQCEVEAVDYKGVMLHLPWITILPVKWFPNVAVSCCDFKGLPRLGQIYLGAQRTDNGFALGNINDEAMKVWARLSHQAYETKESVTIRIVNAEDIRFEDTYRNKAALEAQQREERAKMDGLLKELLGEGSPEEGDIL